MDVWSLDPMDSKGWVRDKCQLMLSICEQIMGEITAQQRSIISRCVKDLYMDIARSKEKYIPTMEDLYDRFIVYGIRDLGESLAPLAMLVMLEAIQQKIISNGENGKATWLYIDEIHVLLRSPFSSDYL